MKQRAADAQRNADFPMMIALGEEGGLVDCLSY
jgi:hypothetical protein